MKVSEMRGLVVGGSREAWGGGVQDEMEEPRLVQQAR